MIGLNLIKFNDGINNNKDYINYITARIIFLSIGHLIIVFL